MSHAQPFVSRVGGKGRSKIHARKAHKKSRQGCTECKRRHMKCDETRPKCVNCNVSERHCSYEEMVSKANALTQPSRLESKLAHRTRDELSVSSSSSAHAFGADDSPPVNKLHLELLHHFVTDILNFIGIDKCCTEGSAIDITKYILTASYLMNQVLAFSALHLSVVHPDKREFYQYHAAQLQTHALSEFNGAKLDISPENCVPIFLFSSCLAMHVLSEKLLFRPHDFEAFLDHFIQSLRMHRGVRAVTSESWHLLLQSPLKSLLENEGKRLEHGSSRHEFLELLALVDAMSFDPAIDTAYRHTIEDLQKAYNGSRSPPSDFSTIGPIISWPVIIPSGYVELLSERRPEALAILSHFGVLLHMHREVWTFGNSGLYLISSINEYLGPQWENWLRWPNSFLNQCD
ncbi:hypothetical protein BGW36DRAFT_305166 [Talaromyces proteolyticus]|uniref:Zn(2)-C6 fungal-type domain-containing protein n=1 Tax=Talaromyces proteolyticus TaxID=1131652 RepID=A0AAD4KGF4_9EURO|nr:uncharacterized protein BGW36DRAFT_305166 [Talaromyces proteolyticus]KAH8691165.1 hypothetical protein BGW36DRAFT_305166 [Talaromyces proteolyticus]